MVPLLELRGVTKRFGGVQALSQGDFVLNKGEIHFLVGANGCGKSTLSKIIVCALEKDGGEIFYKGETLKLTSPAEARKAGIAVVFQELSLVPDLTVQENMFLGSQNQGTLGFVDSISQKEICEKALSRFNDVLSQDIGPETPVTHLSADERQIVEILKVLIREPEVIILDEATSSLHAAQVEILFDIVRELRDKGCSIILISHKMKELFEIGDRATIIRNGVTVATVDLKSTTHDEIVTHMVGEELSSSQKEEREISDHVLLEVKNLSAQGLKDINLSLKKGEILGLSGLQGQGQSELLLTLFGNSPDFRGEVLLDNKLMGLKSPGHCIRDGFSYISGDRKKYGVFQIRSILENTVLAHIRKKGFLFFSRKTLKISVLPILERLGLVYDSLDHSISNLSGGNQQKVIIGRWLMTNPKIILMDDPTKGVDIKTKEELYTLMKELCDAGVSILWNSSEDQEILKNADRVLVLNEGRIVDELSGERLSEYELYKAAMA
ncbi:MULTISPECIES: sugar ABC transporter ATP-binding protein [unclassified Oceanispirochaeta]|uniref:sugar ABC transporter ATP-binding protein n=1 Tax=unclassified Oceanispirochaeta TaxID=2635722 RepID=UPI000E0969BF|nr:MULTISPECIES: sugar ABC transporter ATP-binding protein [unclassified Oceanispirochaeta]MBF9017445.1 sugar ABC transporter ATP-binding protein [Oceanispirochaeta sp. M2]NPD74017.1 sugar ABC transporter ATP-binding protein [Oceanispirochaeta sp. M1]RDG30188.1 sugar ABC transporter ATP-binding protein [Oceanispirochaeta sp. M1]